MTTTSDYLNEFTPDWPHGHVVVLSDGTAKPFVVKVTNVPGDFPIWGYTVDGNDEPWRFRANGDNGYYGAHLRNVAPPKRKPREVWVNYYPNDISCPFASREAADGIAEFSSITRTECVHFREVIGEAEAGEEKLPKEFDLALAKIALNKPHQIDEAFYWYSTPQGYNFWSGYSNKMLSPEDTALAREALRRWIEIAERGVSK
ncbi:MAG: hypothetical protein WAT70_03695 [Rhizobiaceae bacterium]